MQLEAMLLDSWDRQARIIEAICSLIDSTNQHLKASVDGWSIGFQLAHIHGTRRYFLRNVAPERAASIGASFTDGWQTPIDDIEEIKALLRESSQAVREVVQQGLRSESAPFGWYDNPVLFLQHMVWHEGWHAGLIMLALRLGGLEPPEEWEESKIWSEWRTEVWEPG